MKIGNGHNGLGSWDVLSIFAHRIPRLSHTVVANHQRRSVERLGMAGRTRGASRGKDFLMRGLVTASWRESEEGRKSDWDVLAKETH